LRRVDASLRAARSLSVGTFTSPPAICPSTLSRLSRASVDARLPPLMSSSTTSTALTWGLNAAFFVILWLVCRKAIAGLRQNTCPSYVDYAPSLMTSVGLFGTFLGIFIGLMQFDAAQIDASIPQLLGGLQTAFITSIMGMAFAIYFKLRQTQHQDAAPSADAPTALDAVQPKHIHATLLAQQDSLSQIAKGIGGNDERSLVGQFQMLRTDVVDLRSMLNKRQDAFESQLFNSLDRFAEMLSKSATEQVVEALRQVIVEFNQKLTEQFGDNFKRLDESVKKLVDWQIHYREQMDQMIVLYRMGTESIDDTRTAVASIRSETARIPDDMAQLGAVLNVNQHQIDELHRHLDAFVAMRDQAILAVPQIHDKLIEVGEQLRSGAERVNHILIQGSEHFETSVKQTNSSLLTTAHEIADQSEKISDDMQQALDLLTMNTERIRTGVTQAISQSMTEVEKASKQMVDTGGDAAQALLAQVQRSIDATLDATAKGSTEMQRKLDATNLAMAQNADRSLQAVERQVQEIVNRTNDAVNKQLKDFDEAMSKQLNAALQELGSSLGTIAGHLAESYQRTQERQRAAAESR
jgi:predicted transcriptional regulator